MPNLAWAAACKSPYRQLLTISIAIYYLLLLSPKAGIHNEPMSIAHIVASDLVTATFDVLTEIENLNAICVDDLQTPCDESLRPFMPAISPRLVASD